MIQNDIDADWGNAAFDIRHVLTAGFTYNIPAWGTGRFGDFWQFNTIATFQSGSPFTITTGTDTSGTGVRSDRPNLVGDPYANVVQPTTTPLSLQWFNPAAFAVPARARSATSRATPCTVPASRASTFPCSRRRN